MADYCKVCGAGAKKDDFTNGKLPNGTPMPLMDRTEIYALGQKLFGAAMRDAEANGETVMEDGRDEHFWGFGSGYDLLRAAGDYFETKE